MRLLLLHGYGSNREDLLLLASFFPECALIAPHAPVDLMAGDSVPEEVGSSGGVRPKAYAWYRFRFEPVPWWWEQAGGTGAYNLAELLQPVDPGEFRRALGLVVALAAKLRQEPGRLVAGGFSQGAAMACALGLAYPELVDGVILFSGYLPPLSLLAAESGQLSPAGWPVFVSHGYDDPLIPFHHAEEVREYLSERGARVTFQADRCGHEITLGIIDAARRWLEKV